MNTIAFLSMDDLEGYVSDDELTYAPLQKLGWNVEAVSWRNKAAHWERYAAVIVRTTWDYQKDLPAFLETLSEIERKTRLANPLQTIRWNADKVYMRPLEERGAKLVPTLWSDNIASEQQVREWFDTLRADEIIIKPTISAGAEDTFWLSPNSPEISELASVFANRSFMVQPFLRSILKEGEYSLFYFSGIYSHAVIKVPKPNDFRVQEEHGGDIQPFMATTELLNAGEAILRLLGEVPLYARIDFIRDASGHLALMELELIEPSLYLRMNEKAPRQFAQAIHAWLL
ncbi:hypothetical protein LBMAG21_06340 [Armatimonadota bacterium]|nr:hypothetical protein LBMAG21_06340 [Armatimonadota bacterium]